MFDKFKLQSLWSLKDYFKQNIKFKAKYRIIGLFLSSNAHRQEDHEI